MLRPLALVLVCACSPGPGRTPTYPDARVIEDAEPLDRGVPDFGFYDAGPRDVPIGLPDTGPPPSYPFTGVFGVLNGDPIYAREVDGRLSLIVGAPPYHYEGTIDAAGNVATRSAVLERSGCGEATLNGQYQRSVAAFALNHLTCNQTGAPLRSDLSGAFSDDPLREWSGNYELQVSVVRADVTCGDLMAGTERWGVSVYPPNTVVIFAAHGLIDWPMLYLGNAGGAGFSTLHRASNQPGDATFGLSGTFARASANDPPSITAERNGFDPRTGCTYQLRATGVRIQTP